MKLQHFDEDFNPKEVGDIGQRPWRKYAPAIGKPPSNPNYPKKPFNHDEWMKSSKPMEEDSEEMPEVGDTIRTNAGMQGKVERISTNRSNHDEIFFRLEDGRLMKTPVHNVTVVEKLIGEDPTTEALKFSPGSTPDVDHMVGNVYKQGDEPPFARKSPATFDNFDEWNKQAQKINSTVHDDNSDIISSSRSTIYRANDGKTYAVWDRKTNTGRIKSSASESIAGGGLGAGINQWNTNNPVSYEKVLDEVHQKWVESCLNELSVGKMSNYKDKASSTKSMQQRPLRKIVKSVQGVARAGDKIRTKTGDKTQAATDPRGANEGYTVTRGIDTDRYQPRQGLEGPFNTKSGKVVYYDTAEGKYYDPDTDMYIDHDDWARLNEADNSGKIKHLKKWAMNHYDHGADTFIETYGDEDYTEMLDKNGGDVEKTIEFMAILASVWRDRQADADSYKEVYEVGDANKPKRDNFDDILKKQHQAEKPKQKTKTQEIPFNGWTIRYSVPQNPGKGGMPGDKSKWQVMDKRGDIKGTGESPDTRSAVADAEEYIRKGAGSTQQATNKITVDFNVDFARQFAPGGETFYVMFDSNKGSPMIYISTEPQKGFKTSHIRTQRDKVTGETTLLPMVPLGSAESNTLGLQPNGRYILGDKASADNNTDVFPLIYQSTVQGKGDVMRLGKPGLTIAHERSKGLDEACWDGYKQLGMKSKGGKQVPNCVPDANEDYEGPWKGDPAKNAKAPKTSTRGSGKITLSSLVQDSINAHGVKWAFDYYVKKHGIPPRHFKIYAGL